MSHEATAWAFSQRGVGTAKLVLLALADCHNPVYGCFPSQAPLAEVCEIHRDTVNEHLKVLEVRGLIRRDRSIDQVTKRQRSTRYKLAFEADFGSVDDGVTPANKPEKPVSEIPTRTEKAVSDIPTDPCRIYPESRVGNSDTNLVREPLIEPVSAPDANAGGSGSLMAFEIFWQSHPKPRKRERSLELWQAAEKSGVDAQRIIAAAKRYRDGCKAKDPRYIASADNWLEQRRWEEVADNARQQPSQAEKAQGVEATAEMLASKIRQGVYVMPGALTVAIVQVIRAKALLTQEQLAQAGVRR